MTTTVDPTEHVLSKLDGIQEKGEAQWQACCPAHEDNRASLSVKRCEDGRCLVKCHAGCDTAAVLAALNLKIRDLFAGDIRDRDNGRPQITATYPYRDEQGSLLFEVCRRSDKQFPQRKPKEGGGYEWKLGDVRRVVYRLQELLEADLDAWVFIVEGEQDVDRLRFLGLVATCNSGGAEKWRRADRDSFPADRKVVILVDNDEPGRRHGQKVLRSIKSKSKVVHVIELPDLPQKGDVSDWLDAGGTVDELMRLVDEHSRVGPPAGTLSLWTIEGRTDTANAQRLTNAHGDSLRWCDPWEKWLNFDGTRWARDDCRRLDSLAKMVSKQLYGEVAAAIEKADENLIREMVRFAKSSNNAAAIRNMVALARCEVPVLPERLDRHPFKFNCGNGTLDLTTGKLHPHDRKDFITQLCPIDFDPNTKCPTWERFLGDVFEGNDNLIGFIQRAAGYSMTGSTRERCLFFPYGFGANGKTTLVSTLQKTFGEYAVGVTTEMLMDRRGQQHPTEMCDLAGRRMAVGCELDANKKFAEGLLKMLTGGEDRLKGRRMKEDFWEFDAEFKLWISGNHKPRIAGTDDGIWDRFRLIPFNVRFDKPDKTLPAKLESELPGILAWCVRGCLEWQEHGLGEPDEVRAATAEYRSDMDVLGAFLDDRCQINGMFKAKASKLYKAYREWCEASGEFVMSQRKFGERLAERGFQKQKSNGVWYRGIDVRETDTLEGWNQF